MKLSATRVLDNRENAFNVESFLHETVCLTSLMAMVNMQLVLAFFDSPQPGLSKVGLSIGTGPDVWASNC